MELGWGATGISSSSGWIACVLGQSLDRSKESLKQYRSSIDENSVRLVKQQYKVTGNVSYRFLLLFSLGSHTVVRSLFCMLGPHTFVVVLYIYKTYLL